LPLPQNIHRPGCSFCASSHTHFYPHVQFCVMRSELVPLCASISLQQTDAAADKSCRTNQTCRAIPNEWASAYLVRSDVQLKGFDGVRQSAPSPSWICLRRRCDTRLVKAVGRSAAVSLSWFWCQEELRHCFRPYLHSIFVTTLSFIVFCLIKVINDSHVERL